MSETRDRWIDENDVELIDALHLNPRASFEKLGPVLGVSAVTAARRWRKLVDRGDAWISSAPGPFMPMAGAMVKVSCGSARTPEIAQALAGLAHVASVHITTGDFAMYCLVAAGHPDLLSEVVVDVIGKVPGVERVDAAVMVDMFGGRSWALGALDPAQRGALTARVERPTHEGPGTPVDGAERDLFLALQPDGRTGIRDLAQILDTSEKIAKRRLDAMIRTGRLAFRADFVRPAAGWPVQVAMWLEVDDESLTETGHQLAAWPETRVCSAVVARSNLFVTLQLHSLQDVGAVEVKIRRQFPTVRICDRQVLIRPVKSWGRLLGTDGRAAGVVPVDPWADAGD